MTAKRGLLALGLMVMARLSLFRKLVVDCKEEAGVAVRRRDKAFLGTVTVVLIFGGGALEKAC